MVSTKSADAELCAECGVCATACPYEAMRLDPRPIFDEAKRFGCWARYNHCPTKAIYTREYRGVGHNPAPAGSFGRSSRPEGCTGS